MHKRKFFLVGILIVAMLVTVGLTGCSAEQLTALDGVIQNIDSLSGIVTAEMKDGSTLTFNLADVKTETIVEAIGGLSIDPGDTVIIKVDENDEVQEIVGNFSEAEGIIKDLGIDSVVITMEDDDEEEGDITLQITPETVIRIDGVAINFTDLQIGQQVEAKYDVTSLEAVEIEIERDEEEVEGIITAIDTYNYIVTITTEEDVDIVVQVTSDTEIEMEDGSTGVFDDLQLGLQVEVEYDASTMDALEIEIESDEEEVEGIITAIDTDNYIVTITTEEDVDIVVQVTSDTEIEMEDESTAVFADLQLGLQVEVEYDASTMDALEIEVED